MNSAQIAHRFDFYTATHKGHRRRLYTFAGRVGTVDFADPDMVDEIGAELQHIKRMLLAHADHESQIIHPFLKKKFPNEADFLEDEHGELQTNFIELEAYYDDITADPCDMMQCRLFGREFYRALQRFIARYLDHMDEEERTMIHLWQSCAKEELRGVVAKLRSSMTAEQERVELSDILPALTSFERVKLYRVLRLGSDNQRYQDAWSLAESMLEAEELQNLKAALDTEEVSSPD